MDTDQHLALLRRRQFVVTAERDPVVAPTWTRMSLSRGLRIAAHPDLPCHRCRHGDTEVVLLGFATDPRHPGRDTPQILRRVAEDTEQHGDAVPAVAGLGGRWVLLVARSSDLTALADPGGLRQLFYTDRTHDELVCASEPGLIGDHLGLSTSPEAMAGFVETEVRPGWEFWWPGDSSPLRGVRRLLPNHCLDLGDREARRFWPTGPLQRVPKAQAVTETAELLVGQVASAANQFALAQSITAGVDSRAVLAASRRQAADIYYYTLRYEGMDECDIEVPAELLEDLGLRYHVIETPPQMSEEFSDLLHRSVMWPHDRWGAMAEGMYASYPTDRVAMDGTVSEVSRCGYYDNGVYPAEVTVNTLVHHADMEPSDFVLHHLGRWLADAEPAAASSGIALLDLFYWEQRIGSWAASALVELDLVQETFTPFNHRELHTTLLGVDHRGMRSGPKYRLHRDLVAHMWPAALSQPINPVPLPLRLWQETLGALQVLHLDEPLRTARDRLSPRRHRS